jgi:hypothetical protein
LCSFFLESGADFNAKTEFGFSALQLAVPSCRSAFSAYVVPTHNVLESPLGSVTPEGKLAARLIDRGFSLDSLNFASLPGVELPLGETGACGTGETGGETPVKLDGLRGARLTTPMKVHPASSLSHDANGSATTGSTEDLWAENEQSSRDSIATTNLLTAEYEQIGWESI